MNMKLGLSLVVALVSLQIPAAFAAGQEDQHFIKDAIEGNLAEVKMGELAQQHGASQGVKDFGAMLAKDHSAANDKAKQAASSAGVTPPDEPNAKQKAAYQELSALSGEKFDQMFARHMVKDHQEDIAKYEKAAKGSGPVATYAKGTLPDLRKHLKAAESLEKRSGESRSGT